MASPVIAKAPVGIMAETLARQFKIAKFTDQIHASRNPALPALPSEPVRLLFRGMVSNASRRRIEAVFSCYASSEESSFIGHYYSDSIKDFTL